MQVPVTLSYLTTKPGSTQDFIADHAKGSYIWTTDGQKHLDMGAGEATLLTWLTSCPGVVEN